MYPAVVQSNHVLKYVYRGDAYQNNYGKLKKKRKIDLKIIGVRNTCPSFNTTNL